MSVNNNDVIERIVLQVDRLPPMPAHIHEMRAAIANPDISITQILPILAQDPGLSAELLRIVNSARFGTAHPIGSMQQAVLYLGMENFVEYVAASFAENTIRQHFANLQGIDDFFKHSQEVSAGCRMIAQSANLSTHQQEFYALAGLLHDMGKLVLSMATDRNTIDLMQLTSPQHMVVISQEEARQWGMNHGEIGSRICEKWHFPKPFSTCIKRHHTPLIKNDFCPESAMVFLAHILTVPGISAEIIATAIPDAYLAELNLSAQKLEETGKILNQTRSA